VLPGPVYAQSWGAAHPPEKLMYLTEEQIDPGRLLPAPQRRFGERTEGVAKVKRLVQTRTVARFAQTKRENEHEDLTAFAAVIGPEFDVDKLQETSELLAAVINDQHIAALDKRVFPPEIPVCGGILGRGLPRVVL
jgi:hypothetical protein